ncbi:exodeoxyribonuclease VII small subunit [Exilibacterium tricleocarpae]|uniref:Exodeoxyribonuclease 7 small subunit n=1 Tax=Exilibacterium tricleocarpae TaxID=2591008 RepID=A0A545SSV7_9GAMM|nr:exodeoxyribonuclease VII small subunit [Exilibacterium tricleocarpae]TQV68052.1 exodeoxyribonuclease VII small subunit [Exilibacterium tricleocarpae]
MTAKKKGVDFEQALSKLETLVNEMEQGDMTLEESLKAFETGIGLTRECQTRLTEAEQKVQLLVEEQGELRSRPFSGDSDEDVG